MNKVIMIGRFTKEHEVKQLQNGTQVLKNSIAVNRKTANQNGEKETDFFNIDVFGNQIQNVAKFTRKGSKVAIEGEIRNSNYTDQNGQNRTSTSILVRSVEFLDSKNDNQPQFNQPRQQPRQMQQTRQVQQQFDLTDDDLPF